MLVAITISYGALVIAAVPGTGMLGAVIAPGNIFVLAGDHTAFSGISLFLHIIMLVAITIPDSAFVVASGSGTGMPGTEVTTRSTFIFT